MKKVRNILLVALMVLSVITMGSVAGTYAKYTSTANVSDTVTVAKWDIEVGDAGKKLWEAESAFNLFDTIKDSDGTTAEADVKEAYCSDNTSPDRATCEGAGGTWIILIAPGTSGEFALKIQNKSEVTANYSIEFTQTATDSKVVPIQYCAAVECSANSTNWKSSIADINVAATNLEMGSSSETHTIKWRWVISNENAVTDDQVYQYYYNKGTIAAATASDFYTAGLTDADKAATKIIIADAADTALGIASATAPVEVTVTAKITATQVD